MRPRVAISEIMYHPVGEAADADYHEFIELYNAGTTAVSLRGWRLRIDGKERFKFPDSASLAADGYVLAAKARAKLATVAAYGLAAGSVLGDYDGELPNGGATIALHDAADAVVDSVKYGDRAPWPVGADALGAQEGWRPADQTDAKLQYRGRSLERWSFTLPANDPRNWEASPLEGPTPGKRNSVSGDPPAIALSVGAAPEGASGLIRKDQRVAITARLSEGRASDLTLEWFVDLLDRTDEARTKAPMMMMGNADRAYVAVLPPQPDNALVRYRILARRGGADLEALSPRRGDPYDFHAYFVTPQTPGGRTHHILISIPNWTKMWTNLGSGPNKMCVLNPTWDARVPAVFINEGRVHDALVRYSGSRYQRWNGINLPGWTLPKPSQPSPLKTQTWRVSFPRYAEFEGQRTVNLNKQFQACPGPLNALESKLFWAAGVPTNRYKYARLYINGGYYHYMLEVENIDERLMEKVEGPGNPIGDLFKCDGSLDDQALWAKGDWAPIKPFCEFTALQRYATTYERKTHEWKGDAGQEEIIKLIEDLAAIRPMGNTAIRAHFEKNFDVPHLITHYIIRNFAGTWDDSVHNYFPYKRPTDGKWMMLPQDFDMDFGGDPLGASGMNFGSPSNKSIYSGGPQIKNALMSAFRNEVTARAQELLQTVLAEANVTKLLDESLAEFDREAWTASQGRACDLDYRAMRARTWLKERYTFLATGIK